MNCPRCKDRICPHKPSSSDKWRYTLITTVVLLVIMNPYSYNLMEAIFAQRNISKNLGSNGGHILWFVNI